MWSGNIKHGKEQAYCRWYETDCGWYLHKPTAKVNSCINNKQIYKTTDEYLKPIVKKCWNKKYRTTPSCQGHAFSYDTINDTYDKIKKIKKAKCCTTGKPFSVNNIKLNSKQDFLLNGLENEFVGYIGILLPYDVFKTIKSICGDILDIHYKDDCMHVTNYGKNDKDLRNKWDMLYKSIPG